MKGKGKGKHKGQCKKHKAHPDNFGAKVSAEAHRYKAEGLDKSKSFGKWVSEQRRKNGTQGTDTHDKVPNVDKKPDTSAPKSNGNGHSGH